MKFINDNFEILQVWPVSILVYAAIVETIFFLRNKQNLQRCLTIILYLLILGVGYSSLDTLFEYTMKVALGRPRPRETIGLAKEDNECLVAYTGFLEAFTGDNPCNR